MWEDAGAVLVGAEVTEAVQASAEKSSETEPLKVEAAPAVGPQPEKTAEAAES